ncbi:MAG: hypothetical protein K2O97_14445, partial [Acetatifactor sp.]|nr:hypothetical protein [Acetatifactor sp.]
GVSDRIQVCLSEVRGGLADKAIPRETTALLVVEEKDRVVFTEVLADTEKEIKEELAVKDPDFHITVEAVVEDGYFCVNAADTKRAADFLAAMPNGVHSMSADIPGLVETSLNMGILEFCAEKRQDLSEEAAPGNAGEERALSEEAAPEGADQILPEASASEKAGKELLLLAEFSVRSSVESAKHALIGKLHAITELAGGSSEVTGDYPGWAYRKASPLRDKMVALYEKMYGVTPKVEAIHAGLECGILGSKIRDLDCVSIGPQMTAIHTTEETLSIASTRRVWEYLTALLEEKDA